MIIYVYVLCKNYVWSFLPLSPHCTYPRTRSPLQLGYLQMEMQWAGTKKKLDAKMIPEDFQYVWLLYGNPLGSSWHPTLLPIIFVPDFQRMPFRNVHGIPPLPVSAAASLEVSKAWVPIFQQVLSLMDSLGKTWGFNMWFSILQSLVLGFL